MMNTPENRDPLALHVAMWRVRNSLCERIRHLLSKDDAGFARDFARMVAEIEAGLRHEETLLELRGDAQLRERREDNAVVLCALHRAASRVELGQVALGRRLAAAVLDVISAHRLTVDLAFAPAARHARGRGRGQPARALQPGWPQRNRWLH